MSFTNNYVARQPPLVRAWHKIIYVVLFAFLTSSLSFANAASPKAGAVCSKLGKKQVVYGKTFTCVRKGKKLIWDKGIYSPFPLPSASPTTSPTSSPAPTQTVQPAPTATPSPTPIESTSPSPTPDSTPTPTPTPSSFENLYESRKGISRAAWTKVSETIKSSKSKVGTLEIFTGPNTKPHFDDYPLAVELISRAFPNNQEPARTIVVRFEYADVSWAESTLKQKLSSTDYQQIDANSGNMLFISPCDAVAKNCRGASQQTTPSGVSVIIHGVDTQINSYDPTAKARFFTGMLEAHEYFHALQRIPIMGKTNFWPHAWFREGGAEWAQNVVINYRDFNSYLNYMNANCSTTCTKLSESDIVEFLTTANDNFLPSKFERWLNYSLGSWVIESLVALKGQDVMIEMYAEMGKRLTFDQAFKNLFGVEWSYAIPILAKTIHANLNGT